MAGGTTVVEGVSSVVLTGGASVVEEDEVSVVHAVHELQASQAHRVSQEVGAPLLRSVCPSHQSWHLVEGHPKRPVISPGRNLPASQLAHDSVLATEPSGPEVGRS